MNENINDLRISACFAGVRLEAFQTIQRYFDVTSVVTVYDSWVHRHCKSVGFSVEFVNKKNKEKVLQYLVKQSAPIVVSAGFPFILPRHVLNSGAIYVNSHPSLLPAHKGHSPIKEAFKNQEEDMGITVHFMSEEVDSGQIICQEQVSVKGMTLQEIYELLFSVVEPKAISKAMGILYNEGILKRAE